MPEAILTKSQAEIFNSVVGVSRAFGMAIETPPGDAMEAALQDLRPFLGSAPIIGGLAVIHHGYERSTIDIDVLYARSDARILERLRPTFKLVFRAGNGWHHLEHCKTSVRLDLVPEGGLTTCGSIPGPRLVGRDGLYVALAGLIWLKIVAGRSKDDADVVELAKARMAEVAAARAKLPPELHERFDALIARAKKELEHDPHRLPPKRK
jgi:hypothetical protein